MVAPDTVVVTTSLSAVWPVTFRRVGERLSTGLRVVDRLAAPVMVQRASGGPYIYAAALSGRLSASVLPSLIVRHSYRFYLRCLKLLRQSAASVISSIMRQVRMPLLLSHHVSGADVSFP
jgi:hypothetical protein